MTSLMSMAQCPGLVEVNASVGRVGRTSGCCCDCHKGMSPYIIDLDMVYVISLVVSSLFNICIDVAFFDFGDYIL